jgi:hypothetical protein
MFHGSALEAPCADALNLNVWGNKMKLVSKLALSGLAVLSICSGPKSFAHGEGAEVFLGLLTVTEVSLLTATCGLYSAHGYHHHHRRHAEFQKLRRDAHEFLADVDGGIPAGLKERVLSFERVIHADAAAQNSSDEDRVRRYLSGLDHLESVPCADNAEEGEVLTDL